MCSLRSLSPTPSHLSQLLSLSLTVAGAYAKAAENLGQRCHPMNIRSDEIWNHGGEKTGSKPPANFRGDGDTVRTRSD
ncbi:hypothetical protein TIFTF001_038609 [Ficus carica]|uniref:Secreted protein n=1 Tax=Ficus carica TaxID=3494 RepID=A0AA88JE00_FICCA|nr:hypothetical protein TIFTF001_038609 [Ficus carica]